MKVTFVVKNVTDAFWDSVEALPLPERFKQFNQRAREMKESTSMKVGSSNQMRDLVDLNAALQQPGVTYTYNREPRKGYKLVTFEVA